MSPTTPARVQRICSTACFNPFPTQERARALHIHAVHIHNTAPGMGGLVDSTPSDLLQAHPFSDPAMQQTMPAPDHALLAIQQQQ